MAEGNLSLSVGFKKTQLLHTQKYQEFFLFSIFVSQMGLKYETKQSKLILKLRHCNYHSERFKPFFTDVLEVEIEIKWISRKILHKFFFTAKLFFLMIPKQSIYEILQSIKTWMFATLLNFECPKYFLELNSWTNKHKKLLFSTKKKFFSWSRMIFFR